MAQSEHVCLRGDVKESSLDGDMLQKRSPREEPREEGHEVRRRKEPVGNERRVGFQRRRTSAIRNVKAVLL